MEASVRFLDDKTVLVQTQSESRDGSAAGEVRRELRAGDSVWGYSYERWREMGEGSHEIGPKGVSGDCEHQHDVTAVTVPVSRAATAKSSV